MTRQSFHHTTTLGTPYLGTPTKKFKGPVDINCHGKGGIGPTIFRMIGPFDILFEIKFLHWIGFGSIRQTGQKAGHRQTDILGVIRVSKRAPGRILSGLQNFCQIPWIPQLLPRIHVHQPWIGGGNKRCVCRSSNFGHPIKNLHILRSMVEVIVTDQTAIRLSTGCTEFILIHLFKQRALIPCGSLVFF